MPLRPILSMVNSAQHELAKWLTVIIQPVLDFYSTYCLKDSFSFAEFIRSRKVQRRTLMCSFDVKSLFTNVPLAETIKICADKLYESGKSPIGKLTKKNFIELMNVATSSVHFSFSNTMYSQIDGIAMGSPLGPSLANIFVGYNEQKLFTSIKCPPVYFRYVDDTFVIVRNERERDMLHAKLNKMHQNLKFTCETEVDNKLPFLDVLVEKTGSSLTTTIYRKPTFTGQYIRWNSFCDSRRKLNLIKTLINRATSICSKEKLNDELEFLKSTLMSNGYPEGVIRKTFRQQLRSNNNNKNNNDTTVNSIVEKSNVCLRLPYIGSTSMIYRKQIIDAITRCYEQVSPRIIFHSRPNFSSTNKDVLPTLDKSNVVYKFTCYCDSMYVGKTERRLRARIKEHVPQYLNDNSKSAEEKRKSANPSSSIARHLLNNPACRENYTIERFQIIDTATNGFHLSVLESLHIADLRPNLCVQKDIRAYSLLLFR